MKIPKYIRTIYRLCAFTYKKIVVTYILLSKYSNEFNSKEIYGILGS